LNTACSVDHDNEIASHVHLAPGVHTAGRVRIGEGAFLGIGTSVLPNLSITPLPAGYEHAYYRFEFRLNPKRLRRPGTVIAASKRCVLKVFPACQGPARRSTWKKAYARSTPTVERRANAAYLGTVSLALPVQPNLDERYLRDCEEAIRKVLNAATI